MGKILVRSKYIVNDLIIIQQIAVYIRLRTEPRVCL